MAPFNSASITMHHQKQGHEKVGHQPSGRVPVTLPSWFISETRSETASWVGKIEDPSFTLALKGLWWRGPSRPLLPLPEDLLLPPLAKAPDGENPLPLGSQPNWALTEGY